MPRFKLRPWAKPRLGVRTSVSVSGTLTAQYTAPATPVWSSAPTYSVYANEDTGFLAVPVSASAGTVSVTLGWHSSNNPSTQPAWVEFQHGTAPRIRFNNPPTAVTVSPFTLMATASGSTKLSSDIGAGSLAVSGDATWLTANPLPSPVPFTQNNVQQTYAFASHVANFNPLLHEYMQLSGTPPTGVTLDPATGYVYNGTSPVATASGLVIRIANKAATSWAARIADPNVVWYHDFDAAAEVNQFRWSGGIGNDPNNVGNNAFHVASGGVDNGGYLRLSYPVGTDYGSTYWWRPFNPLTGSGNGRGTNDPGANGALTPVGFSVSQGSSTLNNWCNVQPNPGWYGPPSAQAALPNLYQGGEFWLQIRVRRSGTPGQAPPTPTYSLVTGKHVWFNTTLATNPTQEIVNYGQQTGTDVVGVHSFHNAYTPSSGAYVPIAQQSGITMTINNEVNKWRYSGGWDTLLFHITPGEVGGTGTNRTRFEVWAQHDPSLYPAESGVYTKIWDLYWPQNYDTGQVYSNGITRDGWNALTCAIYHNGSVFTTSTFHYDYDQIIFSKATIAAPTV